MLLPGGCFALVESRALKLCVGIQIVRQGFGEATGDCPALGESRVVCVLRAPCLPARAVMCAPKLPCVRAMMRVLHQGVALSLLVSGAVVLPRGGPKFETWWVAFWCKFHWFLVAPCSLLPQGAVFDPWRWHFGQVWLIFLVSSAPLPPIRCLVRSLGRALANLFSLNCFGWSPIMLSRRAEQCFALPCFLA